MKIQKICFLACALSGFNIFAAPTALNAAPAIVSGPSIPPQGATPMSMSPAPTSAQSGAHEEAFLDAASEEKRKEEFLSEVVQDEQKIAQMAKEFDTRLKKIEDAFSGICNNSMHHETGGNLSIPTSPSSKPAGGIIGMPINTPSSQSTITPSGGTSPGSFNTPPAPVSPK